MYSSRHYSRGVMNRISVATILVLLTTADAFVTVVSRSTKTGKGLSLSSGFSPNGEPNAIAELASLQKQVDLKLAEAKTVSSELKTLYASLHEQLRGVKPIEPLEENFGSMETTQMENTMTSGTHQQSHMNQNIPSEPWDASMWQPSMAAFRQEDRFMSPSMLNPQRRHSPSSNALQWQPSRMPSFRQEDRFMSPSMVNPQRRHSPSNNNNNSSLDADPIDQYLWGLYGGDRANQSNTRQGSPLENVLDRRVTTQENPSQGQVPSFSFVPSSSPFNMNEQREELGLRWQSFAGKGANAANGS